MSSVKSAADEQWKQAKHPLTWSDFRDEDGEPQLSPSVVAIDRLKNISPKISLRYNVATHTCSQQ